MTVRNKVHLVLTFQCSGLQDTFVSQVVECRETKNEPVVGYVDAVASHSQ